MESLTQATFDHGVAIAPRPGEVECGDRHLVQPHEHGVLIAVMDGLGHGAEAAETAAAAAEALSRHADESVVTMVRACHEALRGSRGVALAVAAYDRRDGTVTWLGVGNVDAVLIRASPEVYPRAEHVLLRAGVIGHRLPPLYAAVLTVGDGDTLVMATDGVRGGFAQAVRNGDDPQETADRILAGFSTRSDDALVLVGRFKADGS
jgi:serine/threonine protein phosphatase PrpC